MRVISFEGADDQPSIGVMVDDDAFVDVCQVDSKITRSLRAVLEDPDGLDRVRAAAARGTVGGRISAVKMLPAIPNPHAIWALALNFKTHIQETGLTTNSSYPHVFLRVAASQVGHLQPLLCPPPELDRAFDYEGELAVVIGRGGRHIPADKAFDHVAGYSIYNEGSVRAFQEHNRQFGLGKNFESSGSFGPWLMTPDEFGDPARQRVSTRRNGYTRQDAPLSDMLFDVPQIIAYLSTGYALRPGDVIVAGTPGALHPKTDDEEGKIEHQHGRIKVPGLAHMRPGDTVEVEISGLGVLKNHVIADLPVQYRPGVGR